MSDESMKWNTTSSYSSILISWSLSHSLLLSHPALFSLRVQCYSTPLLFRNKGLSILKKDLPWCTQQITTPGTPLHTHIHTQKLITTLALFKPHPPKHRLSATVLCLHTVRSCHQACNTTQHGC